MKEPYRFITNSMRLPYSGDGAARYWFWYQEPMITNTKCTFKDSSVYYQKTKINYKGITFRAERDVLYLDPECTVKAEITRLEKIKQLKAEGFIK